MCSGGGHSPAGGATKIAFIGTAPLDRRSLDNGLPAAGPRSLPRLNSARPGGRSSRHEGGKEHGPAGKLPAGSLQAASQPPFVGLHFRRNSWVVRIQYVYLFSQAKLIDNREPRRTQRGRKDASAPRAYPNILATDSSFHLDVVLTEAV